MLLKIMNCSCFFSSQNCICIVVPFFYVTHFLHYSCVCIITNLIICLCSPFTTFAFQHYKLLHIVTILPFICSSIILCLFLFTIKYLFLSIVQFTKLVNTTLYILFSIFVLTCYSSKCSRYILRQHTTPSRHLTSQYYRLSSEMLWLLVVN